MTPVEIIIQMHARIDATFAQVGLWLSKDISVHTFNSAVEDWNILQILEHLCLANRYLLILIEKGRKKALRKTQHFDLEKELGDYELTSPRLEQIGINNSFEWKSPKHMIPDGKKSLSEIREELLKQKHVLLENLSLLKNGEGVLHKISLSVNSLGRLDVYQYMYFLLMHMQRHIHQMEEIESECVSRRGKGFFEHTP